jgi:CRP-like cAMP-binding protein
MERSLYQSICSNAAISVEEMEIIESVITKQFIRKKEKWLREGDVCKQVAFIKSGCLRSYSVDASGTAHVVQLAMPSHWLADLYSFLNQTPSTLYIEAIEDSEILLLHHTKMEELYKQVPRLERYFRILFQNAYIHAQQRLNATLSVSAEDRYKKLVADHPEILQKVPLGYIASYLGITPESLSRIRKKSL